MSTHQTNAKTTTAKSPFDSNLDADIIISSSDNVDFWVLQSMLSLASPFFKDMFKLAKPTGNAQLYKDGLPVIIMYDDDNKAYKSEVIERLLAFCHPACASKPGDPEILAEAAKAAAKYRMDEVAKTMLNHLVESHPLMVFAFACRFGFEEEAKAAARHTLRMRIVDFPREPALKMCTAWHYHRLLDFHRICGKATSEVARGEPADLDCKKSLLDLSWIRPEMRCFAWFEPMHGIPTPPSCQTSGGPITIDLGKTRLFPKLWWTEYMNQAAKELEVRPSGATVMRPENMDRALQTASECKFCRHRVFTQMREFTSVFRAEVERVISEIQQLPAYKFIE